MSRKSSNSPAPLAVELRPSCRLQWALTVLVLVVAAAVVGSGAPWVVVTIVLMALCYYLMVEIRRIRAPRCRVLRWDGERWLRIGVDGRSNVLRLRRSVVWPLLMVMEFAGPTGAEYVLLLKDSADQQTQRRLRVYLRHLPVYAGRGGRRA